MYHAVLGTFPMATFTKWQLPKYAISKMYFKVANQLGYLALRLGQTWEIAHLELSCHLGKYPWENVAWESTFGKLSLGKIHLGSCRLGKYTWEVVSWKIHLRSCRLKKCPWKLSLGKIHLGSLFWENTFGKLSFRKIPLEHWEHVNIQGKTWPCGVDSGTWKKYYGRGAKQLSYNFNYGPFSDAMFGDVHKYVKACFSGCSIFFCEK